MLTASIENIDNTTWAGAIASPSNAQLEVRPYSFARPRGLFLAGELMLLAVALLQTAWGRHNLGALILIGSCALSFHINNLDRSLVSSRLSQFWICLLESVFWGFLASALLFYMVPMLAPRAGVILVAALLVGLLPVFLRFFLRHLVTRGKFVEQVLIVGTGDLPAKLHRALGQGLGRSRLNTRVVSLSGRQADRVGAVDLTALSELVVRGQISRVVIAERDSQGREKLAAALLDSRLRGLEVSDAVDFYEEVNGKIWIEALNPQWFLYTNGFTRSQAGACLTRCLDVAFALMLILLAAPLLVLIAIAIKLDSAGPVLFRQVRVGLHGKTFVICKFRSMRDDAERDGVPVWAAKWDDRVTRVGRLLRLFRLDELPQAFNVLKGDMSVVGPRPERPCFVSQLEREIPFYSLRHYLKPGITGWAQVMYRYGASVEDAYEKLQYDLYYAKHKSLRSDAAILLKTVRIVLFGRGR
jgi:sugar transferase (PEP-CTERM system associated)